MVVSFRKIMNRVAPKLAAINQFGRNLEIANRQRDNKGDKKKVKFDLATVAFQVNYDTADFRAMPNYNHHHNHHRSPYPHLPEPRIPLWKAHLDHPPNKSNVLLLLLRQLTCIEWAKLIFALFCLIQALIQSYQLYALYRKNYTHSSVNHRLPSEIEFPAITLCLPIIIPFQEHNKKCSKNVLENLDIETETLSSADESAPSNGAQQQSSSGTGNSNTNPECENSLPISHLFNQSMSEYGHQCRVRVKKSGSGSATNGLPGFKSTNCATFSPPIESYFRNKRCFTYLSEITVFRSAIQDGTETNSILDHQDIYINLLIQSNRVPIGVSTASVSSTSDSDQPLLPELFIHSFDKIPIDSIRSPVKLELNHVYKIEYYYLKMYKPINQWGFFHCHNYSSRNAADQELDQKSNKNPLDLIISRQDCLDQCIIKEQQRKRVELNCPKQEDCISHQIPIRRDLVNLNHHKICFTTTEDCPSGDEESLLQSVLDQCDKGCPDDCTSVDVQHETAQDTDQTDSTSSDNSIQVTVKRKITPDIEVSQFPLISTTKLLSDIGGLFTFWFVMVWLVYQTVCLMEYIWELIQLYFL